MVSPVAARGRKQGATASPQAPIQDDIMMKRFQWGAMAVLALAAQAGWAQDATITGVRIAIGDGPVIRNGHIVVQNGRIVAVGPGRPTQVSGTVIDGTGMTAMPGLVDGHKHINSGRLEKEQMADLIEHGFTTVLSGGGPAEGNLTLVQHIDSGQVNGPNVLPSGAAGGFNQTPEQTRERIRALAAQGIRHTGEMATTPEPGPGANELAVLAAAVDEGKKAGVQVNVHSVSTAAMVASTRAGVRHQVHLPNKDFMSFDDAAYIAGTGTIVLDLISFGAPIIDVYQKDNLPRFRTGLRWPESIAGANRDAQGRATGTEGAYTLINARRLWDASGGRAIGYGSDQNYPVRDVLEHELKSLMVMFSMQDIVRIFTINTATYLGLQDEIGTVTPGKRADLVLMRGNPFEDFHDFLETEMVFKAGRIVVDKRASRNAAPVAAAAAGTVLPVGTLTAQMARPDRVPTAACTQLTTAKLAQGRISAARDVPASTFAVPASFAYDRRASEEPVAARCEVTVRRGTGRTAGNVQVSLPTSRWNANLLVLGGGPADAGSVSEALSKGYAVASADAASPVHDVAVVAKAVVAAYYGASPRFSYLESRSADVATTLAAVNANPGDFDGLVVGAQDGVPAPAASVPEIAAFAARGGKIIEYHGGAGRPASTDTATRGYEGVAARAGGVEATRDFHRLFLSPNGQSGDTFRGNWLAALEEWVQRGTAPDVVLVEHTPAPDTPVQRPAGVVFQPPFGVRTVCAYPMVAMTIAQGTETPEQYLCLTPARAAEVAAAR
jgi:imidazolonepropionase-like amidohydrolase